MTKFDTLRLYLFTHSYSAKLLAEFVNKHTKKQNVPVENYIRLLARMLRFRYKDLWEFIVEHITDDSPLLTLDPNLEVFLAVEKELECIALESVSPDSLTREDYQRPTLVSAFERIIGDTLAEIDDDNEFQTQLDASTREYRYLYYKVAWKYRLPTRQNVVFLIRMLSL